MFKPVVNALVVRPIADAYLNIAGKRDVNCHTRLSRKTSNMALRNDIAADVLNAFTKRMLVHSCASPNARNMWHFANTTHYVLSALKVKVSEGRLSPSILDAALVSAIEKCPIKVITEEPYLKLLKFRLKCGDAEGTMKQLRILLSDTCIGGNADGAASFVTYFEEEIRNDEQLRELLVEAAKNLSHAQAAKIFFAIGCATTGSSHTWPQIVYRNEKSDKIFYSASFAFVNAAVMGLNEKNVDVQEIFKLASNAIVCARWARLEETSLTVINDMMETLNSSIMKTLGKTHLASLRTLIENYTPIADKASFMDLFLLTK